MRRPVRSVGRRIRWPRQRSTEGSLTQSARGTTSDNSPARVLTRAVQHSGPLRTVPLQCSATSISRVRGKPLRVYPGSPKTRSNSPARTRSHCRGDFRYRERCAGSVRLCSRGETFGQRQKNLRCIGWFVPTKCPKDSSMANILGMSTRKIPMRSSRRIRSFCPEHLRLSILSWSPQALLGIQNLFQVRLVTAHSKGAYRGSRTIQRDR